MVQIRRFEPLLFLKPKLFFKVARKRFKAYNVHRLLFQETNNQLGG
jgi:hypothetical protein